jgi:hypothetical protein
MIPSVRLKKRPSVQRTWYQIHGTSYLRIVKQYICLEIRAIEHNSIQSIDSEHTRVFYPRLVLYRSISGPGGCRRQVRSSGVVIEQIERSGVLCKAPKTRHGRSN